MKIDSSVNIQPVKQQSNESQGASMQVSVETKLQDMKYDFEVSESLLTNSIEQSNKELIKSNRKVERAVHEKTGVVMYKVIDTQTDEVIREFPPEKIQDMIAKMWELAGLFVDEHA